MKVRSLVLVLGSGRWLCYPLRTLSSVLALPKAVRKLGES